MGVVHAGIDDRHLHGGALVAGIVDRSRADPLHAPRVVQLGIDQGQRTVHLDDTDSWVAPQGVHRRLGETRCNGADQAKAALDASALTAQHCLVRRAGPTPEPDQHIDQIRLGTDDLGSRRVVQTEQGGRHDKREAEACDGSKSVGSMRGTVASLFISV